VPTIGEVTVLSSLRGLCSPAAVAGVASGGAAAAMGIAAAIGGLHRHPRMAADAYRLSPSEISSSEMPDSSSNSINFLNFANIHPLTLAGLFKV